MIDQMIEVGGALVITAGIYSAVDVVGGLQSAVINSANGYARLEWIRIADDDNEKPAYTLYLFNAAPTAVLDNGAFVPAIADLQALVAVVAIAGAAHATINSNAYALVDGGSKELYLPNGKLWWYLTCTATPTFTAITDLTLVLDLLVA